MARARDLDPHQLRASGALLSAHIAMSAAIERGAVDGLDHDPTTMDLLVRLDLSPGRRLRAVDLCSQLVKSPSHISRIIDRAADAGLVTREPDPDDRRANLVVLTDGGAEVVAQFAPRLSAVLDHTVYAALDEGEVDTFVGLLRRVEAAARSYNPTPRSPTPEPPA